MDTIESIANAAETVASGGICVRQSTIPGAGKGLFAARVFEPGDVITLYTGMIRTHEEALQMDCQEDMGGVNQMISHIAMRYVLDGFFLPDGTPIEDIYTQLHNYGAASVAKDPLLRGRPPYEKTNAMFDHVDGDKNAAIVKNHASNLRDLDPHDRATFLRAVRHIEPGDEIFAHYGRAYWKRYNEQYDEEESISDFIVEDRGEDDIDIVVEGSPAGSFKVRACFGHMLEIQ